MRLTALALLLPLIFAATVPAVRPAQAGGELTASARGVQSGQATGPPHVDDHDGSRVGVQIAVAGVAAGLVVGVGTAAYFVRRKLGLTVYSPDQPREGGHH
jgi:hypothetical protein